MTSEDVAAPPARRLVVGATMAAAFIAMMDSSIVNVAVYSIGADLHASMSDMGMMISGYVLFYGLFLVSGGRLGDIYGHRRLFLTGVSTFTLASAACSVAPNAPTLIVLRCVQGMGAALFFPQVLSIVHTALRGEARERALGLFGLVIGMAGVVGQIATGFILHVDLLGLSWRQVFLINVPIGLAVVLAALVAIPRRRDRTGRSEVDVVGAVLLGLAMVLAVFPLTEGRSLGWPWWCLVLLVLSVPVLAAFRSWERSLAARGGQPLAHPALWQLAGYRLGNLALLTLLGGNAAFFFVMVVQVQGDMHYSPLGAALLLTPHAIAFGLSSLLARRPAMRGPRVLVLGCWLNVAGYVAALVAALAGTTRFGGLAVIPALVITGVGQGMSVTPLLSRTLAEVPQAHAGAASGVLETGIQLAISLGITVVGLVYFAAQTGLGPSGAFAASTVVNLVLAVVASLLVPVLLRTVAAPA